MSDETVKVKEIHASLERIRRISMLRIFLADMPPLKGPFRNWRCEMTRISTRY